MLASVHPLCRPTAPSNFCSTIRTGGAAGPGCRCTPADASTLGALRDCLLAVRRVWAQPGFPSRTLPSCSPNGFGSTLLGKSCPDNLVVSCRRPPSHQPLRCTTACPACFRCVPLSFFSVWSSSHVSSSLVYTNAPASCGFKVGGFVSLLPAGGAGAIHCRRYGRRRRVSCFLRQGWRPEAGPALAVPRRV